MLSRIARLTLLVLEVFLICRASARGQNAALDVLLDSLADGHGVRQVAISPDGQQVAWVDTEGSTRSPRGIFVCSIASPTSTRRRITARAGEDASEERGIAWSPDSRQLAFLSNAESPDQLQLYVARVAGGEARKLTDLRGALDAPSWSPDGKSLALLYIENAPRQPGPLEPMSLPSGVIGAETYEQRLTVVNEATGQARQLSPPDMYVYEYDWSPDGRHFAVTAARGAGDGNWFVAGLYTLDAKSGEMNLLYRPAQQIAVPRWSPDGRSVAFVAGLMSDEGSTGGDVYIVPAAGGAARDLTLNLPASVEWFNWQPGGDKILLLEDINGASGVATL